MEAISAAIAIIAQASVAAATIAQASATAGPGGLSNPQRFKAHHPLTFKEGGDPMIDNHCVSPRVPLVEVLMITNQGYWLLMVKLS